jgi:hypothetical protein
MDHLQLAIQTAIKAWDLQISRADKFFGSVDDASLTNEIVPGKNRISYLLGHLIAVNDNINAMFGLSERAYAHLDKPFVTNADRATDPEPDISTLRQDWKKSNEQLSALFARMSPEDWLAKHTAMTHEDYIKEPTRNKLAVLMNRTSHIAYHLGQLMLAK